MLVFEIVGKSEPTAVFGPTDFEIAESAVIHPAAVIDVSGLLLVQVVQVNAHRLIDEHQLLAVRRPPGPVAKSRAEFRQRLFGA